MNGKTLNNIFDVMRRNDVGVLITFIYLFLFYFFVAYIMGNNKT